MRGSLVRVAFSVACAAAPAGAQSLFLDRAFPLTAAGVDVASGDLDLDGRLDLVVPLLSSSSATVLVNQGDGTLVTGQPAAALGGPRRARVVDLNLDGLPDVLVASTGTNPLYQGGLASNVGDGAGGFLFSSMRPVDGSPADVSMADVDGDGFPDAATANSQNATAAVLKGIGNGGFGLPAYLPAPAMPSGVALADLEGDGDADLLVSANIGAAVRVRLNDGRGGFGAAGDSAAGPAVALLVAPLDGDGVPDALVACGDDLLRLLRADGAGGLLAAEPLPSLPKPVALRAADLDRDGDLDVVVSHGGSGTTHALSVLLADGAGGFAAPQGFEPGTSALGFDVADFDGDLWPDVARTNTTSSVSVHPGDGLGALAAPPVQPATIDASGALLVDLDGDGLPEGAFVDIGTALVHVLPGLGAAGLGTGSAWAAAGANAWPADLVAADITGDGVPDLVTSNIADDSVSVLAADGAGGYLAPVQTPCGNEPRALVTADLDGDADPDIVTCNTSSASVGVLLDVAGALGAVTPTSTGSHPTAIAIGHVDAGGTPDVVTANEFTSNFTVLRGNGAGGWLPAVTVGGASGIVHTMALGDFDGDGDDDLAWSAGASLKLQMSDGTGGLVAGPSMALAAEAQDLVVADFDVDGSLDVALVHSPTYGSQQVTVVRGAPGGALLAPDAYAVTSDADSLAAGDADQDGLVDLLTVSGGKKLVTLLRNISGGVWPWTNLGQGLPGQFAPGLAGAGKLLAGTPGQLVLVDAPPLAPAALFFAPTSAPAPFKGGTLVPFPPTLTSLLVVPPGGQVTIAWPAWPPLASGSTLWFQGAAQDAGAPAGVALSNALKAEVP